MKFSIIKHNKNGTYEDCFDGYLYFRWFEPLKKILTYTKSHEEADFSFLPITYEPDYKYDTKINDIKFKNIVILDFIEFGYGTMSNLKYQNNLYPFFGILFEPYDGFFERDVEFYKLHTNLNLFLKDKISVYFKRELSNLIDFNNIEKPIYPADFINLFDEYSPCSQNEFYDRGLDLFYNWGRSNMDRVKMYASILMEMDRFGHNMYTTEKQYEEDFIKNKRKNGVLILHKEWFERLDFKKFQLNSKTSLDLYGSGMKCFRNVESTINCLSFKQDPSCLKHAYPWIHNLNCINLPNKTDINSLNLLKSIEIILEYIRGGSQCDLYKLYLKSCENNMNYKSDVYLKNYIIPTIEKFLK